MGTLPETNMAPQNNLPGKGDSYWNPSFLGAMLVGGFNPFEKYESSWIISPSSGEHKQYLKPPTRYPR